MLAPAGRGAQGYSPEGPGIQAAPSPSVHPAWTLEPCLISKCHPLFPSPVAISTFPRWNLPERSPPSPVGMSFGPASLILINLAFSLHPNLPHQSTLQKNFYSNGD